MRTADRFRVCETLHAIAREHVRVTIEEQRLRLLPACGHQLTPYARSLCRELMEAYEQEPTEVGEMITERRAE